MPKGPRQILLIRHAEKPDEHENPHLSARGFARASALPLLFTPALPCVPRASSAAPQSVSVEYALLTQDARPQFIRPDILIATKQGKISNRPVETITPLAAALGLPINAGHEDKAFGTLADHVLTHDKFDNKIVFICWHHETLPALADALGICDPQPKPWPDDVFDRIWQLDYRRRESVGFGNLPQRLLWGDSRK